jgi:hypothetical protein
MTEIQNPKQLAFDLIFDISIWNLFGPILRSGGACSLLFPVYPDLGPCRVFSLQSKSQSHQEGFAARWVSISSISRAAS